MVYYWMSISIAIS